ncbi:uncharacterized protein LOC113281029 [Papaver somniferum]|uniref:uncharacterized protein LOC113281029 n=1 Tax=Papaver somniferum TaxID=3469 RepID=UPI000E703079|nr:uncharacterized protein LOC113281029 [Papaver somniferum]
MSYIIGLVGGYATSSYLVKLKVQKFVAQMDKIDVNGPTFYFWGDVLATRSQALATLASTAPPGGLAYDQRRAVHLIRFQSNQLEHFNKLNGKAQGDLGNSIESFFCFFDDLFPHLLIQTYRVFQINYSDIRAAYPNDPTVQGAAEYL